MDPTMIDAAPGGVALLEESSNDGTNHNDEEKGDTSTGTNAGEGTNSDSSAEYQIAQSETKVVKRSKTMVYIILGLFAIATAAGVFFYVKNEEQNSFESEVRRQSRSDEESIINKRRAQPSLIPSCLCLPSLIRFILPVAV